MSDVPDGLDPAVADWFDREDRYIEQEIEMIRVFQVKMPDSIGPLRGGPWPNTWWEEFWRSLEREAVVDQRREFVRRWRERHQDGGRQATLAEKLDRNEPERHRYFRGGQRDLSDYAEGSA